MHDRPHNPNDFDNSHDRSGGDAFEPGHVLSDDLLSAYVDGECTAAEQAEVEARIAANPELRHLVEDLRSVRTSLDVLPQYRLESSFAERVLRRAEREVLAGSDHARGAATVAPEATLPAERVSSMGRQWYGSARPFLWTVAALAAAVLILITNRDPEIRRDPIARGPDNERLIRRMAERSDPAKATSEANKQALQIAPQDNRNLAKDVRDATSEGDSRAAAGSATSDLESELPKEQAQLRVEPETTLRRNESPTAESQDAPVSPERAAAQLADDAGAKAGDRDQNVELSLQAQPPATNGVDSPDAYMFTAPAESLRVVEVLVARDAWQRGEVENVFAKNSIAVFDTNVADLSAQSTASSPSRGDKPAEAGLVDAKKATADPQQEAAADGLELLVVSAPVAQVEAALDDFQQTEQFRVVQVTDASAPEELFEKSVRVLGVNSPGKSRERAAKRTSAAAREPEGMILRGGYGRSGYGLAYGAGGATPQATTADLPLGYGQRVMLRQATRSTDELTVGSAAQEARPPQIAIQKQKYAAADAPVGPERVLFFFRVVDAPLAGGRLERANTAATRPGTTQSAEPLLRRPADDKARTVPAAAPAGGSVR